MNNSNAVIFLQSVSKTYEGPPPVKAINKVSIEIQDKEFVAIVGESGSGKTTLLNIIGLLDGVSEGKVYIDGEDTTKLSDDELSKLRGEKIGFIFQSFFLLPGLTALENVAEGLLYQGVDRIGRLEEAAKVLKQVRLGDRMSHLPKELSGGEQQRVAIARALVQNPSYILADEPTGNLDRESGLNILSILKQLNKEGKTVIMITHNREHAKAFDRKIILTDGEVFL
jgi:putative ABC transport system ATP-binding protein